MIQKLRAGKYLIPTTITDLGETLKFEFPYCPDLITEIKSMQGARWNPDGKFWTIKNSQRNHFNLSYLKGENPFAWYDRSLVEYQDEWGPKNIMTHQKTMVCTGYTYKHTIFAAEMGVGKSLAAIIVMWISGFKDWYWIAPKSVLHQIDVELRKWNSKIRPQLYTYEGILKLVKNWSGGHPPRGIICDELSRCKNPNAKRTQALQYLADNMRSEYGRDCYIIGMSGTPSPKEPTDWWSLAEIVCPGFLKEGDPLKFKKRLAIIEQRESITGGIYPHLLGWRDSENRCEKCGRMKDDDYHSDDLEIQMLDPKIHSFIACKNEIAGLYKRLKGLVLVQFKKDCIDLPAKVYRTIECEPSKAILNAATLIKSRESRAVTVLTLHRELSDGFQYEDVESDEYEDCNTHETDFVWIGPDDIDRLTVTKDNEEYWKQEIIPCRVCKGTGKKKRIIRKTVLLDCPKDQVIKDLLDEFEEYNRVIIYAGFTGSIEKLMGLVKSEGWEYVKVDGKGWKTSLQGVGNATEMLEYFQNYEANDTRVAFIAHPGSAGMGLNLAASPVTIYYSNDFNAESRIQSEERTNRIGSRGNLIIDICHLPTDKFVIKNLNVKRDLQAMSMGDLNVGLQSLEREY